MGLCALRAVQHSPELSGERQTLGGLCPNDVLHSASWCFGVRVAGGNASSRGVVGHGGCSGVGGGVMEVDIAFARREF